MLNVAILFTLFLFGVFLWKKSGVGFFNKSTLLALVMMLIIWWLFWGQLAIADNWWFYNEENFLGFRVGYIPIVDALYFFAGIGWFLYFGKMLKILE